MDDTDDREILGTKARSGAGVGKVTLMEGEEFVHLDTEFQKAQLTPIQARKLARHLNRMAGRIERRQA